MLFVDLKRKAKADPTGTKGIRRTLRGEVTRRIHAVKIILRIVIIEQDILGLSPAQNVQSPMLHVQFFARHIGIGDDYKLRMFSDWFNKVLYSHVVQQGVWPESYLNAAYAHGIKAAANDLGKPVPLHPVQMNQMHLIEMKSELEGIVDATLQQTTRMVASALASKVKPRVLKRWLDERLEKIAVVRMNALCNSQVVKVFNSAKLDFFEAFGLQRVGIDPEAELPKKFTHDAIFPEVVHVLTAGDNDVCEKCEDIAASGPYDIDYARDLIPAHANCRCAFIPADDLRYAAVEYEDAVKFLQDSEQISVESGNPYRAEGGRFGSGPKEIVISGPGGKYWKRMGGHIKVFHGSASDVVDKIKKEGIQVIVDRRVHDDPDQAALYKDERGRSVFVTANKGGALSWANMAVARRSTVSPFNLTPIIFELHIPKDEWKKFKSDEYIKSGAAAYYPKNIPPEWIKRVFTTEAEVRSMDDAASFVKRYMVIFVVEKKSVGDSEQISVKSGNPYRAEGGKFGTGGGGEEEKPKPEDQVDPLAAGGDEWNRATSVRLSQEWSNVKSKVSAIVDSAIERLENGESLDVDVAKMQAELDEWDAVDSSTQEDCEKEWKKENYDNEYDNEVTYWRENQAKEEAAEPLALAFNETMERFAPGGTPPEELPEDVEPVDVDKEEEEEVDKHTLAFQLATDALNNLRRNRGVPLNVRSIPVTNRQLFPALKMVVKAGHGGEIKITFDADALKPEFLTAKQKDLFPEGLELSREQKNAIGHALAGAFEARAAEHAERMEPPDYLEDQTNESLDSLWDEWDDEEKLNYAKQNFAEALGLSQDDPSVSFQHFKKPAKFDPLADTSGRDYESTQQIARYLSITRSAEILMERGLVTDRAMAVAKIAQIDSSLWSGWKSSSTSLNGRLLQLATAEELGGRLRSGSLIQPHVGLTTEESIANLKKGANTDYDEIGGYEGVKAYMRGKWETSQYLLEQAGINELKLFRAVAMDEAKNHPKEVVETDKGEGAGYTYKYDAIPTLHVERNGAASASVVSNIPNGWGQDESRVVLRAHVPRTAVISVPAYGINIHHEREVVIAGTAWHGWDAWDGRAPEFDDVPVGAGRTRMQEITADPVRREKIATQWEALNDAFSDATQISVESGNPFRAEAGRFGTGSTGKRKAARSFVSPNISQLTFEKAVTELHSKRQQTFLETAKQIDKALGIESETIPVVGAWRDGAENSTLTIMDTDYETAKLASAMKGFVGNQKSVIVFMPESDGPNFMASFQATGDLKDIHEHLLKNGVENHTLEPEKNGATVHVFGFSQAELSVVSKATVKYSNSFDVVKGTGEFIGTQKETGTDREQRDDARKVYESIIASAAQKRAGRNIEGPWESIRADWRAELKEIIRPDIRESMARQPDNPADLLQPIRTVRELYLRARAAEKSFDADMADIATVTGGEVHQPGMESSEPGTHLKSMASTQRKMRDETKGDPRKVKDILRATIVHDTVVECRKAAAEFIATMGVDPTGDRIVRVQDRFVMPVGAYRDIMLTYRTESGMLAEVQFNTHKMLEAKSVAHNYYRQRQLLQASKERERDVAPEKTEKEINDLNGKEEAEYSVGYQESGNGRGWQKNTTS